MIGRPIKLSNDFCFKVQQFMRNVTGRLVSFEACLGAGVKRIHENRSGSGVGSEVSTKVNVKKEITDKIASCTWNRLSSENGEGDRRKRREI